MPDENAVRVYWRGHKELPEKAAQVMIGMQPGPKIAAALSSLIPKGHVIHLSSSHVPGRQASGMIYSTRTVDNPEIHDV